VPGAEVSIDCQDLDTSASDVVRVWFDNERASMSPCRKKMLAIVPEVKSGGRVAVSLESPGMQSDPASLVVESDWLKTCTRCQPGV